MGGLINLLRNQSKSLTKEEKEIFVVEDIWIFQWLLVILNINFDTTSSLFMLASEMDGVDLLQ